MSEIPHIAVVQSGPDKGRIRHESLAWDMAYATKDYHEQRIAEGVESADMTLLYETGMTIEGVYGSFLRYHNLGRRALTP